ncbi:MAG: membrane integrity-associated transporter subunit PqiC [Rhodospirillaceae bacterium]|nr:membrane integrity-associated transporter subunit PqiC [Rhodospirillaceae bacterium]
MNVVSRRSLISASAGLLLAACSSGPVPVDTYYRLEPATALSPRTGGPIEGLAEVAPLRGEGIVNGRAILFRRSATELQPYSYHFWADTPASMLQRQLIDALRSAKAFDNTALPEMRLNRDYEIVGTLRKLELDARQSRAIIEIELGVRKARGGAAVLLKVYTADIPTGGDDVPSGVKGLSAGLSQICAEFIADLGQLPRS